MYGPQGHRRQSHVHQSGVCILGIVFQGSQARKGLVFHMAFSRGDKAQEPELERACAAPRPCCKLCDCVVQEDGNGLSRWVAGKGAVDRVTPELHPKAAYGGVGHCLGQASELEVQCPEGIVGILSWPGDEVADEICLVVSMPEGGYYERES